MDYTITFNQRFGSTVEIATDELVLQTIEATDWVCARENNNTFDLVGKLHIFCMMQTWNWIKCNFEMTAPNLQESTAIN